MLVTPALPVVLGSWLVVPSLRDFVLFFIASKLVCPGVWWRGCVAGAVTPQVQRIIYALASLQR